MKCVGFQREIAGSRLYERISIDDGECVFRGPRIPRKHPQDTDNLPYRHSHWTPIPDIGAVDSQITRNLFWDNGGVAQTIQS